MYNPNYQSWGSQGWRCPECGRVYSPTQPMCFYCGNQKTWTSPTTTNPIGADDSAWWEEYLKQSETGHPSGWWEDYCRKTTGDSMININKDNITWSNLNTDKIKIGKDGSISWTGPVSEIRLEV